MSNELAQLSTGEVFATADAFELAQRQAIMLCKSDLVPKQFQGEDKIGNCVIALEMASRMGTSPFMVMQNIDIIHGKPGFSSKFLIGTFNACGRFEAIRYQHDDEEGGRTRAISRELATGEEILGPWVSMEMAKVEGWLGKNGSKWKTMPELMRCYRAAAFMIRTVAPELSLGLHTREEILDTDGMRQTRGEELKPEANPFAKRAAEVEHEPELFDEEEKEA